MLIRFGEEKKQMSINYNQKLSATSTENTPFDTRHVNGICLCAAGSITSASLHSTSTVTTDHSASGFI